MGLVMVRVRFGLYKNDERLAKKILIRVRVRIG